MIDTPRTDAAIAYEASMTRTPSLPYVARHLERELAAATRERDEALRLLAEARSALDYIRTEGVEALRLLAEARAAAPDADPREQPIVGMVHDSRHGVYVDLPRWWLGRRVRVQALRDGGANATRQTAERNGASLDADVGASDGKETDR